MRTIKSLAQNLLLEESFNSKPGNRILGIFAVNFFVSLHRSYATSGHMAAESNFEGDFAIRQSFSWSFVCFRGVWNDRDGRFCSFIDGERP